MFPFRHSKCFLEADISEIWSFLQKPRKPVSVIIVIKRQRTPVALQILLLFGETKNIDIWIRLVCVILYLYFACRPLWTSQGWTWASRSITPMFTTRLTATSWTSKSRYIVMLIISLLSRADVSWCDVFIPCFIFIPTLFSLFSHPLTHFTWPLFIVVTSCLYHALKVDRFTFHHNGWHSLMASKDM